MGAPPNCLGSGNEHDGAESISLCVRCYDNIEVLTEAERAVVRAAVAWCDAGDDYRLDDAIVTAVDALLAAQPEWGKR
jgi:hypothetical protein